MRRDKDQNENKIKDALLELFAQTGSYTQKAIAEKTGLSERTIQRHMKGLKFVPQDSVLKVLTPEILMRLYQRATGYSHEAVKIFMPSGSRKSVKVKYTQHYPPDTAAIKLWMQVVEGWSEKIQQEHSGEVAATNQPPVLLYMKRYKEELN